MMKIVAIGLCSVLVSCATTSYNGSSRTVTDGGLDYFLSVDAISNIDLQPKKKFIITSAMKDVNDSDLRFKEFARIASNALQKKGFTQVDNLKKAEMVILLSFAVTGPVTTTHARLIPIFRPPTPSTTTDIKNQFGQSIGSYDTRPSNPFEAFQPPDVRAIPEEETTYSRAIILGAYDSKNIKKSSRPEMLWETRIISNGSSGDLRKLFPVMMYGAIPYLGENSGVQKEVTLHVQDFDFRIHNLTLEHPTESLTDSRKP